jgi:3-hydroxyisobutyrate dehydrogenase-like beta-hydroxyacid dehydrogenase
MKLGFIGVGNMGNPMAANLIKAGHELTVHDLNQDSAANLLEAGATWADTPAAATTGQDATFLSLPAPPDVKDVVLGAGGVLAASAPGSAIVDLSTNSPILVRELAEAANAKGVGFLDSPVSGGVRGARDGTLAVMVGGDAEVYERFKPAFEAIGANVFHVGPIGAGNVAKLVNNQCAFIHMMGLTEALVLGAKAGIDPMVLRDVVRASSGAAFVWDGGARAILKDRLAPSFNLNLATKDIGLAQDLADAIGVSAPMGKRAQELLVGYRDNGYALEDVLATVKALEEQAGHQVRGTWHD